MEFLGIWEQIHNPSFNYGEFTIIKSNAGLNSYKISVKEWTEKTNAIGIFAKAGRYGGTYAYRCNKRQFYSKRVDKRNISIVDAVIREMKEETGLLIEKPHLCGVKQFPIDVGEWKVVKK